MDWEKIKAEYVRGGISMRNLADKHHVARTTLMRHASVEKWSELRKKASVKADAKLIQKTADAKAETAARLMRMQDEAALKLYENILALVNSFRNYTRITEEVIVVKKINGREFPLHKTYTRDIDSVVRAMATLARLYGIDAASQLSRERFELQKEQGGETLEAFNAGMLSIAELINHPMPDRTMEDVEKGVEP